MNIFPPSGLLGNWVLREKMNFLKYRKGNGTLKYLFSVRKETTLHPPVISETTVPDSDTMINEVHTFLFSRICGAGKALMKSPK